MDLYAALNVARDAAADQIKKAYRQLAKTHHPDKGGDPEKFHAIALAYDVLSDDAKRARYDETGKVDEKISDIDGEALQIIGALVDELSGRLITSDGLEHVDLVADMRKKVAAQIESVRADRKEAVKFEAKATKLRKRFKAKKGPDYVGRMLDNNIEKCRGAIRNADERMKRLERAQEILADAEFEVEPRQDEPSFYTPDATTMDMLREHYARMRPSRNPYAGSET